jgi:hypothetical protein
LSFSLVVFNSLSICCFFTCKTILPPSPFPI